MKVPYVQLGAQHREIRAEILERIGALLDSGQFILGEEVQRFETEFARLHDVKYAAGVANGTDALFLSMIGLGIGKGDEVITAPNSFLASASSIHLAGARPVFADVRDDFNLDPSAVERAITSRTKAIMPVHLTGRPADMDALLEIAKKHNLLIIEDCAQAVLAEFNGKKAGSMGNAGCFSLHPLKNLAACGDGGVITTNDEKLYRWLLLARNHGLKNRDECAFWSYNSRLDAIQAAILNVKLGKLSEWTERRRNIAKLYTDRLKGLDLILPQDHPKGKSVYHTYIIQSPRRDALKKFLEERGVDSKVHYPLSIHLQEAAADLGYKKGDFPAAEKQMETILSLPVFAELSDAQVNHVCDVIHEFHRA